MAHGIRNIFLATWFILFGIGIPMVAAAPLTLWHSYRGAEAQALTKAVDVFVGENPQIELKILRLPYEVMASKLSTAMPRGNGPDVFIYAHEKVGSWQEAGLVWPLDKVDANWARENFFTQTVNSLEVGGALYGYPLSFKSLVLFRNKLLVPHAPETTAELLEISRSLKKKKVYGLAYQADSFYFHAPWYLGFGASIPLSVGDAGFSSEQALNSYGFVSTLAEEGLMPQEITGALVVDLFNREQAAMAINGPWMLGEVNENIDLGVSPLPEISQNGQAASPFLTTEALFIASSAQDPKVAREFARFLAGKRGAALRAEIGKQPVAYKETWREHALTEDPVLGAFLAQLSVATPVPNSPAMSQVWEPGDLALKKLLRGGTSALAAGNAGMSRHRAITRSPPEAVSPVPYVWLLVGTFLALLFFAFRKIGTIRRRGEMEQLVRGIQWTASVWITTGILIFIPFIMAMGLALFSHRFGEFTFVGLGNFKSILGGDVFDILEPLSFYFALLVTLLWTLVNIVLHVVLGVGLALLLNQQGLRLKGFYRVLLILPWAVPNYITALIWKGMFHRQFGVINGILNACGVESVAWFSSFWTAFCANVCANAWLGFPFMMVVCLGALQSIPKELFEAADMDGAGFLSRFRHVTYPLLVPAMAPAVLLGIVWTFNQFNIVYLVSGGEPDNSTDILISEAWRWAFGRHEQYGYAAAYGVLIFILLLGWSVLSTRVARRLETS